MTLSRPVTVGKHSVAEDIQQEMHPSVSFHQHFKLTIMPPQHRRSTLLDFTNEDFHLGMPFCEIHKWFADERSEQRGEASDSQSPASTQAPRVVTHLIPCCDGAFSLKSTINFLKGGR